MRKLTFAMLVLMSINAIGQDALLAASDWIHWSSVYTHGVCDSSNVFDSNLCLLRVGHEDSTEYDGGGYIFFTTCYGCGISAFSSEDELPIVRKEKIQALLKAGSQDLMDSEREIILAYHELTSDGVDLVLFEDVYLDPQTKVHYVVYARGSEGDGKDLEIQKRWFKDTDPEIQEILRTLKND